MPTLYDKVWDDHCVATSEDGQSLLYIDRHLLHEVTSPQAFEGLALARRKPWRIAANLATPDHNVPTDNRELGIAGITDPIAKEQVVTLDENCRTHGITQFDIQDIRQGIVHVVGPEQGATLPGMTVVCGDSHTSTHGAFAALAQGIGTSEVEHVLATQTLAQNKAKNYRVQVDGELQPGVTAKDLILAIIGEMGTAGGTGHTLEYMGSAIRSLSMEGRMTLCNMSIEAGARAGMVAVDDRTLEYVHGRPMAPVGALWDEAETYWRTLRSDSDATFESNLVLDATQLVPYVSWGTSPELVAPITGATPDPSQVSDDQQAQSLQRALDYMGLAPNQPLTEINLDRVFIGSCTNARIEDLRAVAQVVKGKRVASRIKQALIVPGSGLVKQQAEAEGLAQIFVDAGFDWRAAGCSMCLAMNPDRLQPGEHCAATSNRNFEGRQGHGGRTHLVSPAMAAAAAITGHFVRREGLGMKPVNTISGTVAPLDRPNVDTDQIIPKQFLKSIRRTGFGDYLFDAWRFLDEGDLGMTPNERRINREFVLNDARYQGASVLLARDNFGCGSSREHAVWSLQEFGFECVIAPSFADIFYNNSLKNGLLPITLPAEQIDELFALASASTALMLTVDLESCTVSLPTSQQSFGFSMDEHRRYKLLQGLDDISLALDQSDAIKQFEAQYSQRRPWLFEQ